MSKFAYIPVILMLGIVFLSSGNLSGQEIIPDTVILQKLHKQEVFYDSLRFKAKQRKVTKLLYEALISPPRPYVDKKALALDYFNKYEGKIIAGIDIRALDVFGPTFDDTTKTADNWMERAANTIHTESNLKTIKKQLFFKVGDVLDPNIMYENERIIRQLPYIKDVKILVDQDSLFSGFVNVTILTKDRFSFGASGGVQGTSSGDVSVYNKNIFGIGHEVSVKFVGHVREEPYLGLETFYKINNLGGRFINAQLGYLNTYRNEGFVLNMNKPFYTDEVKWGYGASFYRMLRTERLTADHPLLLEQPINEAYTGIWVGRSYSISNNYDHQTKLTLTGGINNLTFFDRPEVDPALLPFFSNRTLYLAGINISQRRYIQDQLIFSYGITEDIPEGFKNEIIYGYDANEFGDRHYVQFFSSNGNLLLSRKGYIYLSTGIGGYIKQKHFEEGLFIFDAEFISKLVSAGKKRVRTFVNLNYTYGINRYQFEYLTLQRHDFIRGFSSKSAIGKQRLVAKLEHVVFLPHQFYKFNIAVFGFADLGIIGKEKEFIFKQNYYSGLGVGIRLHNENLVFETFRIRLSFYPFHPKDVPFVGFIVDEQSKKQFNSFDPAQPAPMRFE